MRHLVERKLPFAKPAVRRHEHRGRVLSARNRRRERVETVLAGVRCAAVRARIRLGAGVWVAVHAVGDIVAAAAGVRRRDSEYQRTRAHQVHVRPRVRFHLSCSFSGVKTPLSS